MADIELTLEAKVEKVRKEVTAFAGETQGKFAALGTKIEGSTIGVRKFASSLSKTTGIVSGLVGPVALVIGSIVGGVLVANKIITNLLTLTDRQNDLYRKQNRELGEILDNVEKIAAARRKSGGVAGAGAEVVRLDFAAQRRALEAQLDEARAAQRNAAPTFFTRFTKNVSAGFGFSAGSAIDEEIEGLNKAEAIRSALLKLTEEEVAAVKAATAEEQRKNAEIARAAAIKERVLEAERAIAETSLQAEEAAARGNTLGAALLRERVALMQKLLALGQDEALSMAERFALGTRLAEIEKAREAELKKAARDEADDLADQLAIEEARANMQEERVKMLEREQALKRRLREIDKLQISEEEKAALRAQAQRIAAANPAAPPKVVRESFLGFAAGLGGGLTASQALGDPARDERRVLAERVRSEIEKTRMAIVEALKNISIPKGAQFALMGP